METSDTINIISIDPGNNLGVSIYKLDAYTLEIVGIETRLRVLEKQVKPDEDEDYKLLNKLSYLSNFIKRLIEEFEPVAIGIETAFLNMKFPKAVINLSQYVSTIEMTAYKENKHIKFFRYKPKFIKKGIEAGGDAKKEDMTKAVLKIKDITKFVKPDLLSEHEVDSLAIGYILIKELREFPFILYVR